MAMCSHCQSQFPDNSSFCGHCGGRLTATDGDSIAVEESADSEPGTERASTGAKARQMAGGGRQSSLQDPFASNPFRVLRLPAGASGSQIRQTIEQGRIEARLGSDPEVESRLDVLTKAQAELLNPSKRIQHEVLWFYDPPECLYEGSLEETDQALARFRAGSESEEDRRSVHDLALWLLLEANHGSDPPTTEDWTVRALSAWSDVAHDAVYLHHLPGSARSRKDAAKTIWELGVGVLAASSRRCMNSGDLDGVLSRYRGAKSYGLEESDLIKVVEPAIEIVVLEGQRKVAEARADSEAVVSDPARARSWAKGLEDDLSDQVDLSDELPDLATRELDKVLDEAAGLIRSVAISLHNDQDETQLASDLVEVGLELAVSKKTVEQLESDLGTMRGLVAVGPLAGVINTAVSAIQDGDDAEELFDAAETLYDSLVDYEGDEETEEGALESALPVLRAVAIRLHNEYGETANAVTVMGWCVELAEDEEERAKFERDHRQLQYQMHLASCYSLVAAKRWAEAEGAAKFAYSYAESADDRRTANDAIAAIVEKRKARDWRPAVAVTIGAAVIGLFVLFGGGIGESDDGSTGSSSPPIQLPDFNPQFIPSLPTAECVALENTIDNNEETLNTLKFQMNSLESRIDAFEARYSSGPAPNELALSGYKRQINEYNDLVGRYNSLLRSTKSQVSRYNSECV